MEYKAYKLRFLTGVHFGKGSLDDTSYAFCADTLFSALCIEALKDSEQWLNNFVNTVKSGKLIFSDAMPYIGEDLYIPKPMCEIKHNNDDDGNSSKKKFYKKLQYIPYYSIDDFINGDLIEEVADDFEKLGKRVVRVSAAINGQEQTVPYRVGAFYYNDGNGLYIIVGYENKDALSEFEILAKSLGISGIGGERSSGLGRFEIEEYAECDDLLEMIGTQSDYHMTLSVSLPNESELESVLEDARYKIIKRSGFVASSNYRERRKKDLYVLAAGACVTHKFEGDIYDVGSDDGHAVYRYAKPVFMEVRV